jgi:flagellar hook-length control protein FliK
LFSVASEAASNVSFQSTPQWSARSNQSQATDSFGALVDSNTAADTGNGAAAAQNQTIAQPSPDNASAASPRQSDNAAATADSTQSSNSAATDQAAQNDSDNRKVAAKQLSGANASADANAVQQSGANSSAVKAANPKSAGKSSDDASATNSATDPAAAVQPVALATPSPVAAVIPVTVAPTNVPAAASASATSTAPLAIAAAAIAASTAAAAAPVASSAQIKIDSDAAAEATAAPAATATTATTTTTAAAAATAKLAVQAAASVANPAVASATQTVTADAASAASVAATTPGASKATPGKTATTATATTDTRDSPTTASTSAGATNSNPGQQPAAASEPANGIVAGTNADAAANSISADSSTHAHSGVTDVNLAPADSSGAGAQATGSFQALLPTAATTAPATSFSVSAATNAAVPLSGLALEIAASARGGSSHFEIRLDPAELGRIDVSISVDRNGQVSSHLTVEKPETLSMLQQDAPQLQQALNDAGFKTGGGGLQFSLRDQSSSGQNSGGNTGGNAQRLVINNETAVPATVAGRTYGRMLGSSSGVDISV